MTTLLILCACLCQRVAVRMFEFYVRIFEFYEHQINNKFYTQ